MWLVSGHDLFIDPDIAFGLSEQECVLLEVAELGNATDDANAFAGPSLIVKLEFDAVLLSNLIWDHGGVLQISMVGVISGHVGLEWYLVVLVSQF